MKLYSQTGNVQSDGWFAWMPKKVPDWTLLEWIQFVLIALIFVALASILGMIIFVLIKIQSVADKAQSGELTICNKADQNQCSSFSYGLIQPGQ